jgi:hypothetical protein
VSAMFDVDRLRSCSGREASDSPHHCGLGDEGRTGLASERHFFHGIGRPVCDGFLDASVNQSQSKYFQPILEYHSGIARDDSLPSGSLLPRSKLPLVALSVMTLVGRSSGRRLERGTTASSVFFSVTLWCLVASGVYSLFGPFLSLPNKFLAGFSAAAGIALINSIGNLGGFVGPSAMGAISNKTGSFRGGLVFAGIPLFMSALLVLALQKRTEQQGGTAMQRSPAAMPTADTD